VYWTKAVSSPLATFTIWYAVAEASRAIRELSTRVAIKKARFKNLAPLRLGISRTSISGRRIFATAHVNHESCRQEQLRFLDKTKVLSKQVRGKGAFSRLVL